MNTGHGKINISCTSRISFSTTYIQHFLCDFFNFMDNADIADYGDDTAPYSVNKTKELAIH